MRVRQVIGFGSVIVVACLLVYFLFAPKPKSDQSFMYVIQLVDLHQREAKTEAASGDLVWLKSSEVFGVGNSRLKDDGLSWFVVMYYKTPKGELLFLKSWIIVGAKEPSPDFFQLNYLKDTGLIP